MWRLESKSRVSLRTTISVVKMYTSDFGLDVFMLRKHFFQIVTGAYV